jgi:arginase
MSSVKIIEVKSELGAGTRGASMGPDAIRIAAMDFRSDYFKKYPTTEVKHDNHLLLEPPSSPYAKRIQGVIETSERVAAEVKKVVKAGSFPIVLSGDHSTAIGTITGLKMAYPDKRLGVIWIDAHADLHSPYTTPSGNVHGMPLAALLGFDNLAFKKNSIDKSTAEEWEKLKHIGGISPKIEADDLVFLALRDYEPEEGDLVVKNGIAVYTTTQIRNKGIENTCRKVLADLDSCDHLYISFDVDSLDPSVSKGTGTTAKGGLLEREMANLILGLFRLEKVICFEITEVNPTLDNENTMAEAAFTILQKVTNEVEIV